MTVFETVDSVLSLCFCANMMPNISAFKHSKVFCCAVIHNSRRSIFVHNLACGFCMCLPISEPTLELFRLCYILEFPLDRRPIIAYTVYVAIHYAHNPGELYPGRSEELGGFIFVHIEYRNISARFVRQCITKHICCVLTYVYRGDRMLSIDSPFNLPRPSISTATSKGLSPLDKSRMATMLESGLVLDAMIATGDASASGTFFKTSIPKSWSFFVPFNTSLRCPVPPLPNLKKACPVR